MLKKFISAVLAAAMMAAVLPAAAFAEGEEAQALGDNSVIYNKDSKNQPLQKDVYFEEDGIFLDDHKTFDVKNKPTRYSYSEKAKLGYRMQVLTSGNYKVEYWSPAGPQGTMTLRNQQLFTIKVGDKTDEVRLNLKGAASGWKDLGVYSLGTLGTIEVTLSRSLKDGPIRSGSMRITKVSDAPYVAKSDEPKKTARSIPEGNGILATASHYDPAYTVTRQGSWSIVGQVDCRGWAQYYAYQPNATMQYKLNMPTGTSKRYHIMRWDCLKDDKRSNEYFKLTIKSQDGGAKTIWLDNGKFNDWVYLGEFTMASDSYIEIENFTDEPAYSENRKILMAGGFYFAPVDDPDFDSSKYIQLAEVASEAPRQ